MNENFPDNPQIQVLKSGKTGLFTNYIYKAIPLAFDESMSYYETLCGLLNYLKNVIIPTVNNNANAVAELQTLYEQLRTYVDNYFTNLDVQDEINNKLDEMVEDGTLPEIVASYLNSKAVFGFDNVASMKQATNLINGSYAETLGYYDKNDGGKALYKIRNITNQDVVNEMNIIALSNNNLIAELICNNELNLKQFGIQNNENIDTQIQNAMNYCLNNNVNLYIPAGKYYITQELNLQSGMKITGCRTGNWANDEQGITILVKNSNNNLFKMAYLSEISHITIDSNNTTGTTIIMNSRNYIHDITIKNFDIGIQNNSSGANLSRFERITMLSGNIGVNLLNIDNLNTQSCTFMDFDIRECLYGLISYQPASKYYNFCVQNGKTGGNAVVLNAGANNNIFYGSYFENANYTKEVDLTTSKFNKFTGCRVFQYLSSFANNDGSNIIECTSIQNQQAIVNGGFNAFEKLGVMIGENSGQPSQYLTLEKDPDTNLTGILKTNNTSSSGILKFDNIVFNVSEAKFSNNSRFRSPFAYNRIITPTSLTAGQSYSIDSTFINKQNIIAIASTNKINVICQVTPLTNGGMHITLTNNSDTDYSNQDIQVYIFGCVYE